MTKGQILILRIVKDICEQHAIVNKDGIKLCDTENCPFAKRSLDINFHPTDWYSCIADYPYLYEMHKVREVDMTKQKIIDIFDKYKFEMMHHISMIPYSSKNEIADEFLTLIEQEKIDLLKEFVEWLKGQNCIIMQLDCAGTMKCDNALEKFLEERK